MTVYTPVNTGKPAATRLPNTNNNIIKVRGPDINSALINSSSNVKSNTTSIAKFPVTHFSIFSGAFSGNSNFSIVSFRRTLAPSLSIFTWTLIRDQELSTSLIRFDWFASLVNQG